MATRGNKAVSALGFLTVCDLQDLGLVGGYLLLNPAGRPLEFHCTAPVRASRAQQILYGPTLEPFLCGEQIGRALVEKPQADIALVFTDRASALSAQAFLTAPFVLVEASNGEMIAGLQRIELAGARVAVREQDVALVAERWASCGATVELTEPFERIREALREANRDNKPKVAPTSEAA